MRTADSLPGCTHVYVTRLFCRGTPLSRLPLTRLAHIPRYLPDLPVVGYPYGYSLPHVGFDLIAAVAVGLLRTVVDSYIVGFARGWIAALPRCYPVTLLLPLLLLRLLILHTDGLTLLGLYLDCRIAFTHHMGTHCTLLVVVTLLIVRITVDCCCCWLDCRCYG